MYFQKPSQHYTQKTCLNACRVKKSPKNVIVGDTFSINNNDSTLFQDQK